MLNLLKSKEKKDKLYSLLIWIVIMLNHLYLIQKLLSAEPNVMSNTEALFLDPTVEATEMETAAAPMVLMEELMELMVLMVLMELMEPMDQELMEPMDQELTDQVLMDLEPMDQVTLVNPA